MPKPNEGVGLKNLEAWNKAWIAKLVWEIAKKKDNLWIRWVHGKYLINKDWCDYTIMNDLCWYWSKLCMVKEEFKWGSKAQKKWYWEGNPKGEYKVKAGYEWH